MRHHGYVLTMGCYVGAEAEENDSELFEDRKRRLILKFHKRRKEAAKIDAAIASNLENWNMTPDDINSMSRMSEDTVM